MRWIDTALDRSVVLGYTRIGPALRRRLPGWPADPAPQALRGRHAAVTGATSGLGLATARGLLDLGAHVHAVVRDVDKAASVFGEDERVSVHRCDVGDLDDLRRFATAFLADVPALDVLVHNAGAMPATRTESAQGHELTMSLHLLGPVLMTDLLRPALAGRDARVILVTSGGMYAQALRADDPDYVLGDYSPTTAYARSKRAQCEVLAQLQARWGGDGIGVYATHPGWAATPGVTDSLPGFDTVMGPLLRDAESGADTTVWLAAVDPAPPGGGLWHDRRVRPIHWLGRNRPRPGAVEQMWGWVLEQTSVD